MISSSHSPDEDDKKNLDLEEILYFIGNQAIFINFERAMLDSQTKKIVDQTSWQNIFMEAKQKGIPIYIFSSYPTEDVKNYLKLETVGVDPDKFEINIKGDIKDTVLMIYSTVSHDPSTVLLIDNDAATLKEAENNQFKILPAEGFYINHLGQIINVSSTPEKQQFVSPTNDPYSRASAPPPTVRNSWDPSAPPPTIRNPSVSVQHEITHTTILKTSVSKIGFLGSLKKAVGFSHPEGGLISIFDNDQRKMRYFITFDTRTDAGNLRKRCEESKDISLRHVQIYTGKEIQEDGLLLSQDLINKNMIEFNQEQLHHICESKTYSRFIPSKALENHKAIEKSNLDDST